MAANDEFPRGWTLNAVVFGAGEASVTLGAITGINHVLDHVTARLFQQAAGGLFTSQVAVTTPATTVLDLLLVDNIAIDEGDFSNLDISSGPGTALTVQFTTACAANQGQILTIQGHDI